MKNVGGFSYYFYFFQNNHNKYIHILRTWVCLEHGCLLWMNPLLTVLLLLNCSRGQCYVLQEYHEGSICCKQPAGVEILLRLMVTWMFAIYLDLTVYAVAFQTWCDIQRV